MTAVDFAQCASVLLYVKVSDQQGMERRMGREKSRLGSDLHIFLKLFDSSLCSPNLAPTIGVNYVFLPVF